MGRVIRFDVENPKTGKLRESTIPARWDICKRCGGEGHHGNPVFDGLSVNYFREDPEFAEGYFSGRYDVRCSECDGHGKVLVPDEEAATPKQLKAYQDAKRQEWEANEPDRAEARYFARFEEGW